SDALVIIWCGCFVSFAQKMEAIDRIRGIKRCTGRYLAGWIAKRPAFLIPNRIDNCHTDRFFESFQLSKNDRATGPWARQRNIKMITTRQRDTMSIHRPRSIHGVRLPGVEILPNRIARLE